MSAKHMLQQRSCQNFCSANHESRHSTSSVFPARQDLWHATSIQSIARCLVYHILNRGNVGATIGTTKAEGTSGGVLPGSFPVLVP